MDPADLLTVELEEQERRVLIAGLNEWSGPARPTDELAAALGFSDLENFSRERLRLRRALEQAQPLTRLDWARVLLATEVVFVSNVVGSGHDWMFTVGISDQETLSLLRTIQLKLTSEVRPLIGRSLGTRPE